MEGRARKVVELSIRVNRDAFFKHTPHTTHAQGTRIECFVPTCTFQLSRHPPMLLPHLYAGMVVVRRMMLQSDIDSRSCQQLEEDSMRHAMTDQYGASKSACLVLSESCHYAHACARVCRRKASLNYLMRGSTVCLYIHDDAVFVPLLA
jgi:hypothetical protein